VFDISNPADPIRVGGYNTSDYIPGSGYNPTADLAVSGKYLYVANGIAGLKVFDVSNPANPILAGQHEGVNASAISLSGTYAYVVDSSALKILRIEMLRDELRLSATLAGNEVVLRWLVGPGFVLQSASSVHSSQWEPVGGAPDEQNGIAELRLSLQGQTRFFQVVQVP
jgi:hypothetical protein